MTACHWRLQMPRSCRARTMTLPPRSLRSPAHPAQAWTPIFSVSCLTLWRSWVWNGLPHRNHPVGAWMSGSCRGAVRPLDNKLHHSSQRFTTRSPSLGMHPTLRASSSSPLTSVDSAEEKGYYSLPSLNESVAMHLCLPTAIGWKARFSLGPSWCLRQVQVLVVPLADTAGLYWFP